MKTAAKKLAAKAKRSPKAKPTIERKAPSCTLYNGKKLYKVLLNGRSFHGGNLEWSLPKDGKPGDWHKMAAGAAIVICRSGFHLTTEPAHWWQEGCQIFEVEAVDVGQYHHDDRKVVAREVRLVRELPKAEQHAVCIFWDGNHKVEGDVRAIALGSSSVEAWGSSRVEAWESSRVVARESSRVVARGSSRVEAWGSSRVEAWESSRVVARGSSRVEAWGSSRVEAWESSRVVAWESSSVVAHFKTVVASSINVATLRRCASRSLLLGRNADGHALRCGEKAAEQ